jgi:hypothetical protein
MKHKPTTDELYSRIMQLRKRLPRQYTKALIDRNPELGDKAARIRKVVGMQTTDEEITVALEKLVKQFN